MLSVILGHSSRHPPAAKSLRGGCPGIVGLMVGSYVYAETSDYLSTTIKRIGNRGRIMLPDLIGMRVTVHLLIFVSLLVSSLFILQRLTP